MKSYHIKNLPAVRADNGGLAILNPGWSHPRRVLTSSVLILGLKGAVPLTVGGDGLEIVPGRAVLLPAGVEHAGGAPLRNPASYYWLHFTTTSDVLEVGDDESETILSTGLATDHVLDDSALVPLAFDLPEPERIKDQFRELLNLQEQKSYTDRKFLLGFQLLLIGVTEAVISAHRPQEKRSPSATVVSGVVQFVAEHLADPNLSVKTIAGTLGLNLDYVGRRFRQIMGLSVGEYILKQRVRLALVRLQRTSETVDAVAAAAGFGSFRHFLRQFKSTTGQTPTEARDTYRRMHVNSI